MTTTERPYHVDDERQYPSFRSAASDRGILGLSAENCEQYGFVIPFDEAQPVFTAGQQAVKADKPTPNDDGTWSYKWAVRDKTPEEILADLPYHDKETAKASVLGWADRFLRPLKRGYSETEVASWPLKGPAAINYLAGVATPAETLMLQAEVDALQLIQPGITLNDVATIVAEKAEPYIEALAFTSALRQIVNAQIDATTELAEIPPILEAAQAQAKQKAGSLRLPGEAA